MKKIFAFLFAAMFVFNLFAVAAESEIWSGEASESFKGEGSVKSPYLIETAEDLALLSDMVYDGESFSGKHFLLKEDISLNSTDKFYSWEENPPENIWKPIGNARTFFKGTFDGNGKTITGLYVSDTAKNYVGLFGYVKDGEIKNLNVEKSFLWGRSDVGVIVGFAESSKIENVSSEGFAYGKENIGGIAGSLHKSSLNNAVSNTEIVSMGNAGGVSGYVSLSSVNSVTSKCEVKGILTAGGIIGRMVDSVIRNAYSNEIIEAESYSGGIAGYMDEFSELEYVYSVGSVVSDKAAGGIAGASYGSLTSVYFKGFVSGEYGGAIVGINSPLSEDSDLPEYGEIENAYYAEERCEKALGYTLAEEDDQDILPLKAEKINSSFIKSYILNQFISEENLEESPDDVWTFNGKNPELWIENQKPSEKPGEENTPPAEKPEIGVKIGEVVSTDIRAYINGKEIKAVNIGGKMAIALKDLREFGFEVTFDEEKRTVSVIYNRGEIKSTYSSEGEKEEIGSYISDVLSTDIVAYLDNEQCESFNAEGYTHIYFRSLSAYGEVSFDEEKREAELKLK